MRSAVLLTVLAASAALAADPPAIVNYQGVLRDAQDKPRTGTFDMVFRFFDASSGGSEILVNSFTGGGGNPVIVTGGLFNVQLGRGTVTDGSGPGTYISLDQVFRDFDSVWLQISVGAETLSPLIRVQSAAYALNASNLQGKGASSFLDTSGTAQSKGGRLTLADPSSTPGYGLVVSTPSVAAVQAFHTTGGAVGYLGYNTIGVWGEGSYTGGFFKDANATGSANVGYGDTGIQANGNASGGIFYDNSGSSATLAGSGYGIDAYGSTYGARFTNSFGDLVKLGEVGTAVHGVGGTGGWFQANNGSGAVTLAYSNVGMSAFGNPAGTFSASGFGYATIAQNDTGVYGYGRWPGGAGGYFEDSGYSGKAWLGIGDTGLLAKGNYQAGEFQNPVTNSYVRLALQDAGWSSPAGLFYNPAGGSSGVYVEVASSGSFWPGIFTNGSKNFAQNHPFDPSRLVVYTALEGPEAGTYTRGSGRLVNGEATIALDPTFALTTSPDVGLTAILTARAGGLDLYVASVSTHKLVVRAGKEVTEDAAFDYVVNGLRLGFESAPSIIPKEGHLDSPVPSPEAVQARLAALPEDARASTPLARLGAGATPELPGARALIAAIDAPEQAEHARPPASAFAPAAAEAAGSRAPAQQRLRPEIPSQPTLPPHSFLVAVDEPVQTGDVLSNDLTRPGKIVRSAAAADSGVLGIVAGEPASTWRDSAPVALAGTIVLCKVDASYGAIATNDLLVASPTRGHAMRAGESPGQGTVVAKALEPLDGGTGTIRVLVMAR